jgi:hypothetical protein
MALVKNKPAFEDTNLVEAAIPDGDAITTEEVTDTQPKTEVKVTEPTVVAIKKPLAGYTQALTGYQDAIPPSEIAWGTFPRVKVDLGGFEADDIELGTELNVEMFSYNERFVVSAGEDSPEANDLVRFSLDGIRLDLQDGEEGEGQLVSEYLAELKEDYPNASSRKYLAIYGMLDHEEMNEMVEIQVPPTSVPRFNRLQINTGIILSRLRKKAEQAGEDPSAIEESPFIKLTQVKRKGKTAQYAMIEFTAGEAS